MSSLGGNSLLNGATITGTNTWTFLSVTVSKILLALKIFITPSPASTDIILRSETASKRGAVLCSWIPESSLTALDIMDIKNILSGFMVMLAHCKVCRIVADVLRRKVHFKFPFFLYASFWGCQWSIMPCKGGRSKLQDCTRLKYLFSLPELAA